MVNAALNTVRSRKGYSVIVMLLESKFFQFASELFPICTIMPVEINIEVAYNDYLDSYLDLLDLINYFLYLLYDF